MSETTETTATATLPPGMTITTKTLQFNNSQEVRTVVTFGSPPRTIAVVDLDMGAQFDLAEITGGTDNLEYRNLAFVAASVREIDGVPANPGMTKNALRGTLKSLGRDGLKAATAAIRTFSPDDEPDIKAAAGN